jgi:hypothetical protein
MDQFLSIILFDSRLADARRRLPAATRRRDRRPHAPERPPSRLGLGLFRR